MLSSFARGPSIVLVALGATLIACGGPAQEWSATMVPFTAQDAPLFENGIDMVHDPRALEGPWLTTWEREFETRVERADLIAVVTVGTLRTDVDLDRHRTFRLVCHVDRALLGGRSLGQEEIVLAAVEGQGGFGTVESNERTLLEGHFVAFIRWRRDRQGELQPRWHLAIASEPVVGRAQSLVARRLDETEGQGRRRVIVYRNE